MSQQAVGMLVLVGCLTSQQHASVSLGRICSDNFTCFYTEIQVADPTFHLTQSQYTDTGPTSASTDPRTPGAWQGSHWSANFEVTGMTRPRKKSRRKRDSNPGSSALEADALPLGQRGGQAVGNGGRPAPHHPIPGNMWTEGLSTADRPQKKKNIYVCGVQ